MSKPMRVIAQVVAFCMFMATVGYFSSQPVYTHFQPEKALIKLSFSHAGQPITECRRLTQEELNLLAPNMRKPTDCPRERVPLYVEFHLDGKVQYQQSIAPTGLANDGAATVYARIPVSAGSHSMFIQMRDSRRAEGFDHTLRERVELEAGQNFVIDFEAETGGFKIL